MIQPASCNLASPPGASKRWPCRLVRSPCRAGRSGVPQDHAEAVRWHRRAADQGGAQAQHNLGVMHAKEDLEGAGVTLDFTEAARLCKLAADQGFQPAREALGQLAAVHAAGTRVRITGLAAAAHLNSRLGTVVHPPKPLAAGRIAVRIDGQTKSVSLSVANVQPPAPGCGAPR